MAKRKKAKGKRSSWNYSALDASKPRAEARSRQSGIGARAVKNLRASVVLLGNGRASESDEQDRRREKNKKNGATPADGWSKCTESGQVGGQEKKFWRASRVNPVKTGQMRSRADRERGGQGRNSPGRGQKRTFPDRPVRVVGFRSCRWHGDNGARPVTRSESYPTAQKQAAARRRTSSTRGGLDGP